MSEKPLQVRVVEALGHKVRRLGPCTSCIQMPTDGGELPSHVERPHYHWEMWQEFEWEAPDGIWVAVPNYPEAWSATGPLIEKHEIYLNPDSAAPELWWAGCDRTGLKAHGDAPLIAVCNLILRLAEGGKL